jgi:hypothetical protein
MKKSFDYRFYQTIYLVFGGTSLLIAAQKLKNTESFDQT